MDKAIFEKCETCLQDEPAACSSWCPLHFDVAAFCNEMAQGEFQKSYKMMQKRIPLAGIIGMICDHPCEDVCVRGKYDHALRIQDLERAAVLYGYVPVKKSVILPKKNGNVVVIGGGISGITAAMELDKKGFRVTIMEQQDRIGGRIWDFEGKQLNEI